MTKIFALLAIVLILTGVLLLAVPRGGGGGSPSLMPESVVAPTFIMKARDLAEQVNAPLSILFGIVSLIYSRRSYQINRARAEAAKASKTS